MAGSFEKTNLSWQVQQLQQQAWQWVELQLSQLFSNLPEFGWPSPRSSVDWSGLTIWIKSLSWLILGLLLIWGIWQLRRLSPALRILWPQLFSASVPRAESPAHPPASVAVWLQQAQEYRRQGDYQQACRALYLAMLQRLDDAGIITGQPSRTDGEYRQLLQNLPQYQRYLVLLNLHEQQWFGGVSATEEDFQRCFKVFQELDKL
jgi:hypothetical protein